MSHECWRITCDSLRSCLWLFIKTFILLNFKNLCATFFSIMQFLIWYSKISKYMWMETWPLITNKIKEVVKLHKMEVVIRKKHKHWKWPTIRALIKKFHLIWSVMNQSSLNALLRGHSEWPKNSKNQWWRPSLYFIPCVFCFNANPGLYIVVASYLFWPSSTISKQSQIEIPWKVSWVHKVSKTTI